MTDLRVVLLAAGALILGLLWLLELRRERNARRQKTILRRDAAVGREPPFETRVSMDADDSDVPGDTASLPPMSPRGEATRAAAAPGFIAIHVHAPAATQFQQENIFAAAAAAGLEFDSRGIFVMPGLGAGAAPLFNIANLHEPGTFSREPVARPSRGLILILPLPVPAPDDPGMVLDLMLHTAELLAGRLGGTVLDAARRPLDGQGMQALRRVAGAQGDR